MSDELKKRAQADCAESGVSMTGTVVVTGEYIAEREASFAEKMLRKAMDIAHAKECVECRGTVRQDCQFVSEFKDSVAFAILREFGLTE